MSVEGIDYYAKSMGWFFGDFVMSIGSETIYLAISIGSYLVITIGVFAAFFGEFLVITIA